jgi:hypothetical protein
VLLYGAALPPLPVKRMTVASSHMRFIRSLFTGVATGTSRMRLAYAAVAIFFHSPMPNVASRMLWRRALRAVSSKI